MDLLFTRGAMERVLLSVGMALLVVYVAARIQATMFSRLELQSFEASLRQPLVPERAHHVPGSLRVDFSLWSEPRINAYKQSLAQHLESPLAVLRVSTIEMEVPVLNGTDDLTLNRGAGWIRGTARPDERGNIGIAGHRDGFFRGLKDLKVGETMDLVTRNRTDTYVVDQMRVVNPDDIDVLRPSATPSLTLVTCYPFYFVGSAPQRYIVHASIVRSQPLNTDVSEKGDSAARNITK